MRDRRQEDANQNKEASNSVEPEQVASDDEPKWAGLTKFDRIFLGIDPPLKLKPQVLIQTCTGMSHYPKSGIEDE
ncbi:MAG: hypothetical protein JHD40_09750 [Acidimicrobiia bacterium]|nr:hypothetical protein [Acidimicrobiia bacterium]